MVFSVVMMLGFVFLGTMSVQAHEDEGSYTISSGEKVEINGQEVLFQAADESVTTNVTVSPDLIDQISKRPQLRYAGEQIINRHRHPFSGPYLERYHGMIIAGGNAARVYVCGQSSPCGFLSYVRV